MVRPAAVALRNRIDGGLAMETSKQFGCTNVCHLTVLSKSIIHKTVLPVYRQKKVF